MYCSRLCALLLGMLLLLAPNTPSAFAEAQNQSLRQQAAPRGEAAENAKQEKERELEQQKREQEQRRAEAARQAEEREAERVAGMIEQYTVGTKVEVVRWSRFLFDDYGYAGIVKEVNGRRVTLEVCAFVNVNRDVESSAGTGYKHLIKGQDIGTEVEIDVTWITGYYSGANQDNYNSANRTGQYEITDQYDWGNSEFRTYKLRCLDGGSATVTYWYESKGYTWTTFSGSSQTWPVNDISFHQAAVKACKGELN